MKKTFLYILAVILLCGVTVSCSKNDDDDSKSQEASAEKTIFVFFPYADNLSENGYQLTDVKEMKNGIKANGNMDGYRVLVYYGEESFRSYLYEIKIKDGKLINDTLKTYSNVTQKDEQFLTTMFKDVKSISPTKSYTMIIGGHGNGWAPSDVSWSSMSQSSSAAKRSFGAALTERDRIETSTFSNAMTAASLHTDLILFDCCHMDNIETLYDIHTNTDYVIASAAEQPGYGMPYDKIWNDCIGTISTDKLKDILSIAQSYYDNNNTGYNSESANSVNPLSLAAIDCSEIDNIAAAMANLNKKHETCCNDLTQDVQRFDKKIVSVYFDLLDYAKYQVGGDTSDANYKSVESAVKSAVISTACNNVYLVVINPYSTAAINCWPVKSFCGIATSDPTQNSVLVEKKTSTSWWKATH